MSEPATPTDLRMIALNYRLLNRFARTTPADSATVQEQAASLLALADHLERTPNAPTGAGA